VHGIAQQYHAERAEYGNECKEVKDNDFHLLDRFVARHSERSEESVRLQKKILRRTNRGSE